MLSSLRETGFFVGSFGWLPDYVVVPIVMLGVKLGPRFVQQPLARLFARSLRWASKPPFATLLQLEVEGANADGEQRSLSLRLSHSDGYGNTVAARDRQHLTGHAVEAIGLERRAAQPAMSMPIRSRQASA